MIARRRLSSGLRLAVTGLVAALLHAAVPAQPAVRGVPTLTAFVKQFGELERTLADAVSRGDNAVLDRLLSPIFEVRRADGQLVPREDWQAAGKGRAAATLRNLAVHEAGPQAIASYHGRDASGGEHFVVDVWVPAGDGQWQLRVRFDSPVAGAARPATGARAADARPDGKR